jgi:hypothetical protein
MELTLKVESHMGIPKAGYSLACKYYTRAKATNTLAYYSTELITTVESFIIVLDPMSFFHSHISD